MKLNRIRTLCKARNHAELYQRRDGKQFLSDGCGIWPVDEKLKLNEAAIQAIFDVPRDKWESGWYYQEFDYACDPDAETKGLPECLLEDVWAEGSETELKRTGARALIGCAEMWMFATQDDRRHIWASAAQLAACPDRIRLYALREAPGGRRVLAIYDDFFCGGLVLINGPGYQREIQETLRELSQRETM